MGTLILVRHGRTQANVDGILAGRTAGVDLDDRGREQAAATAERLTTVPLVAVVSSPLDRCRQTSALILDRQQGSPEFVVEDDITECDYGDWQGGTLKQLSTEKLWKVVQSNPSAAVFPGGESLATMQSRAVAAIRRLDAEFEEKHGPGAVWAAVSHGDIIKSVLADAYGMHLDLFQRISVDPASISIIRYTNTRPYVMASNTHEGDLGWLVTAPKKTASATSADDAAVGGGAGPEA